MAPPQTPSTPAAQPAPNPIRQVLASRDFRFYWGALFLAALIGGITRFAFVWMAPEISDSRFAAEILFFSVGIPGLIISLPAGAWSDRVDRRRLVVGTSLIGAAFLFATALLIWLDLINLPLAMLTAFGIGSALAVIFPALQAMIPQLVPANRLMSAVGLQNMGQSVAQIAGAVVSGGSIQFLGLGGAFAVWTAVMLGSAGLMWMVALPPYARPEGDAARSESMLDAIKAGVRYTMGRDPLRSLILVGLFMGTGIGTYGALMPEIGRDELGQGPLATSLLFAMLSLGMVVTSLFLASRRQVNRRGLMFLGAFSCFGPGLLAIGLSNSYPLTMGIMVIFGLCGGVLMTSQRTLLQEHTEPHMMGRVMSLFALTFNGLLPISALYVALMRTQFGPGDSLAIMGALTAVGAIFVASRSQLRHM